MSVKPVSLAARTAARLVRRALLSAVVVLPAGGIVYSLGFAQSPAGPPRLETPASGVTRVALLQAAQDPAAPAATKFVGYAACDACHKVDLAAASRFPKDLCLLNESAVLENQDKHAVAYDRLFTDRGRKIFDALGIAYKYEEQKVGEKTVLVKELPGAENLQKAKACLSCHANWHASEPQPPSNFTDGVRCESCHGPAKDWEGPHQRPAWRSIPIADKEKLGMVDVRNPVKRAQQCFSCHIGNSEQGKIVTHEMYAAGHPPLPGIEIESFASQMPEHWRHFPEKGDFANKAEFVEANFGKLPHDPTLDLPRTKAVVIGGVMALRESVALLADTAAKGDEAWPELAVFDCAACHHDLKSPSWRQTRGYEQRVPGRPIMFEWPTALVQLGLLHVSPDAASNARARAALEANMTRLRRAVYDQPFGQPESIRPAADALLVQLDDLAAKLAVSRYDAASARKSLDALLQLNESAYPDFHSARQLAWAAKTILSELQAPYPERSDKLFPVRDLNDQGPISQAKDALEIKTYLDWIQNTRDPARKHVDELFGRADLNTYLNLRLPAGKDFEIEDAMKTSLDRIAKYDAAEFRARLQHLSQELENAPPRQAARQ